LTEDQFTRELGYQAALAVARRMHDAGLLTTDELAEATKFLLEKYLPLIGGLTAQAA